MTAFAELIVKTSLVMLLGMACAWLARRRAAALRHWIIASGIVCGALLPLLGEMAPAWSYTTFQSSPSAGADGGETTMEFILDRAERAVIAPVTAGVAQESGAPVNRTTMWLVALWAGGFLVSAAALFAGLFRVSWLAARSPAAAGEWDQVAVTVSTAYRRRPSDPGVAECASITARHVGLAASGDHPAASGGGLVSPAHADRPQSRARARQPGGLGGADGGGADPCGLLVQSGRLGRVPAVAGRQRRGVRRRGHRERDQEYRYAEELVTVARALAAARCDWYPAPAMARTSSLERRVTAMLTQRSDRRPAAWTARLTTSLAVALLAVMVAGFDVFAQSFATLSGTVVDQTGAFVPRASLVLVKRDADARYEIHSSDTGVYSFEGLAPGRYELQAQSPGFRNLVGEVVVDGRNLQRNITLQVGALEETISIVHRAGDPVETGDRPRQPRRESFVGNTACLPSVVGGRIEPPTKIADARPRYPAQLAASSAGAVIVLNTVIGTDGFVRDARAAQPGADPDFLASAIAAVQQWQFTPTLLNCAPIEVEMTVTARFSVR